MAGLYAGKRVHDGVEVGRDRKPEVLKIVAGVDDDSQTLRRQHRRQAHGEARTADSACKGDDHRNKSSARGRISSAMELARCAYGNPRASTAGHPSSDCPMSSEAAAASSSAAAT